MSDSKKLKVNAACSFYNSVILAACFLAVRLQSVWHKGSALINIYMIEQMSVHKVTIALVIISGKSSVLVKVYACNLRENSRSPFFSTILQAEHKFLPVKIL